jgi:exoribonuclease II
MATQHEYKARIVSFIEGKDPIVVQRRTPELLAQLIEGRHETDLQERPETGKWSVAELLAHLADAEICASWRYRQMIEHNGGALSPYDQDLWNMLGSNTSRNAVDSLQLFRLLREGNVRVFEKLTDEEWGRHGIHAERGEMSVRDLMQQIAGHDLNHVKQIRNILAVL